VLCKAANIITKMRTYHFIFNNDECKAFGFYSTDVWQILAEAPVRVRQYMRCCGSSGQNEWNYLCSESYAILRNNPEASEAGD
jgi:hypothetical protein